MGMIATDRRASDEVGRDEVRVCVRDEGLGCDALETPIDTRVSAGHGPYVVAAAAATPGETDRLDHHDKSAHPTLREEDGAEEMDDETGGCADAAHAAAETFAAWVTRRIDLLLGLAFLGVALWLRAVVLIGARRSSPLARDEHAWRWVLFVACVFLGRYLARSLVSFAVFVLDRYVRACSDDADFLNATLYYLTVLRAEIKTFLIVLGITVSWSTLMRPVRQIGEEAFANAARGLTCACVALFFRVTHRWIIKTLTSRLHSSTFWEQLHSTVRQENILKKLAGPPIRPRPRGHAKTRARRAHARATTRGRERPRREDAETETNEVASGVGRQNTHTPATRTVRSFEHLVDRVASAMGRGRGGEGEGVSGSGTSPGRPAAVAETSPTTSDAVDGARLSLGVDSPSDAECPRDRSSDGEHAAFDAPISAAAAAAAVGASEGAREAKTNVSLAVINAAVRHVRRGTFSLPFRVTTRGIGALKGRGKSKHRSSQEAGSAAGGGGGGASLDPRQKRSKKTGGTFHNAGALHGDATTVEQEADAAATMMFHHLRRAGQPFVTPDAVADFVEADKVEEAFLLIGGADSGVRALAEANISAAMRKVYLEREALGKTLSDTSNLVNNVGVLIAVVLGTVTLFISLGVFRVDVASLWLVTSSALLAFAFVFGTTAATMFRTLVMIFVTNPFGVGDWIRINEQIVRVTELGLNFFVVVNFWGEVIFLPASQVLDARIFNLSRSPPLWMNTAFDVDIGVSAADIDHIQTVMSAHVDSDGTNYVPGSFSIGCRDMHDPFKVRVTCFYQLAFNASELDRKFKVNSRFLLALQIALMDINFTFTGTDGSIFKCEERLVGPTNAHTSRRASRVLAAGRHASDAHAGGGVAESRRVSFSHGARAPDGAGSDVAREILRGVDGSSSSVAPIGFPTGPPAPPIDAPARDAPPISRPPERHDSIGDLRAAGFASDGAAKIIIAETIPASMGVDGTAASAGAHLPAQRENDVLGEGVHVPGIGVVLPEKDHGVRFRGRYRIPGRIRHYSGQLRDMREIVTFDAHEGQFDD